MIRGFVTKSGRNARTIPDDEILERCIFPMINEDVKILEEGKAIRASDQNFLQALFFCRCIVC